MINQVLEGQHKLMVNFNGKIDVVYIVLNSKFESLNNHSNSPIWRVGSAIPPNSPNGRVGQITPSNSPIWQVGPTPVAVDWTSCPLTSLAGSILHFVSIGDTIGAL
ncbi:hypothetical protein DY000_02006623 [Brassica cretica]|uniref:Uncharacterized protein n=1 Tax=Brassica cretica TaxID=69181 RepID=A0ABQ7BUW8_BRACR|nr:hypothetical protein DY000_02006623 [Brassica cretica]